MDSIPEVRPLTPSQPIRRIERDSQRDAGRKPPARDKPPADDNDDEPRHVDEYA